MQMLIRPSITDIEIMKQVLNKLPTIESNVFDTSLPGSNRRSEPKQVMFSDGIRPGGDLAELDGSSEVTRMPPRRSRGQKRVISQGRVQCCKGYQMFTNALINQ